MSWGIKKWQQANKFPWRTWAFLCFLWHHLQKGIRRQTVEHLLPLRKEKQKGTGTISINGE